MRFLESIVNVSYWLYSAVMIVIGLGIIILAFMNSPIQLQITLGLLGLGFITLGLVQVKQGQDKKINETRFDIIVTKLDDIQQELKQNEQNKGTGVVIADVLSSGLKYYSDSLTKQKQEEDSE
jgi:Na+/phosphate symporter